MKLFGIKTILFHFIIVSVILISLINTGYAQTQSDFETQSTLSEDLQNDPVAQDLLKKIEQTRKMIDELKQKELEKNQDQENLEKARNLSVEHLNQDLDEWERLWEKHSSRNAFESFVSKKPSYVQGVFWDQFEFKEQKVNAGRLAMNQVLERGGNMQDARDAYNKAAATKRIELIEINSQINVKHNLATFEEQQVFNSTGQVHFSPAIKMKLANLYADYKLQPSYILANSEGKNLSKLNSGINSDTPCDDGYVLVSRVTTGVKACIDEQTAKKWINDSTKEIIILGGKISDDISPISIVKTNPGTNCEEGYRVIYNTLASEYQCVLESNAKEMMKNSSAEIHTLVDYILNKDKQKIEDDIIFEINQEILNIKEEFNVKKKKLAIEYNEKLENEDFLKKQKTKEIFYEYQINRNVTKEDLTKQITEAKETNVLNKEKILQGELNAVNQLELKLKNKILGIVKGYESNPDINVDWDYLQE